MITKCLLLTIAVLVALTYAVKVTEKEVFIADNTWAVSININGSNPTFQFWPSDAKNSGGKSIFELDALFEQWISPCIKDNSNTYFECPCTVDFYDETECNCLLFPDQEGCPCNVSADSNKCICLTNIDQPVCSSFTVPTSSFSLDSSHVAWSFDVSKLEDDGILVMIGVPVEGEEKVPFAGMYLTFHLVNEQAGSIKFDLVIDNYEWTAPVEQAETDGLDLKLGVKFKFSEAGTKDYSVEDGKITYDTSFLDIGETAYACYNYTLGIGYTWERDSTIYNCVQVTPELVEAEGKGGIFYLLYPAWTPVRPDLLHDPVFGVTSLPSSGVAMMLSSSMMLLGAALLRLLW